jgi:hypothetical protein
VLGRSGILGFVGCAASAEIVLRYEYLRTLSLDSFTSNTQYPGPRRRHGAGTNVELSALLTQLAQWMAYMSAATLMFSSMFYSGRESGFRALSGSGSQRSWFDWHVWSGSVGPMLVMLHTAGKLDNWVSLAVWSMVAAVLSGLVGRYIYDVSFLTLRPRPR